MGGVKANLIIFFKKGFKTNLKKKVGVPREFFFLSMTFVRNTFFRMGG